MKNENSLLAQLIKAFKILPGVGEKSAQRMAFYLLENNREGGIKLSKLLTNAMENIRNCASCRNLTEDIYCDICSDTKRDNSTPVSYTHLPSPRDRSLSRMPSSA